MVNRQTKAVLNSTDEEYIEEIAHYLPFRATLHENLRQQIIPRTLKTNASSSQGHPGNITAMCAKLSTVQPFFIKEGLINVFSGKKATDAEQRGLLECHDIGERKLTIYF